MMTIRYHGAGYVHKECIMRIVPFAAMCLIPVLMGGSAGGAQEKGDIKIDIVKYDGLKDTVLRHRGKVVLVDFWGYL